MADSYTFPWERSAMEGSEMPGGLTTCEQQAWQAVAKLYARFRLKVITREQGHAEKGKIKYALEQQQKADKSAAELAQWHADLRRNIEGAQNRYMRAKRNMEAHPDDPTFVTAVLDAADLMCAVIDGRVRALPKEEEK